MLFVLRHTFFRKYKIVEEMPRFCEKWGAYYILGVSSIQGITVPTQNQFNQVSHHYLSVKLFIMHRYTRFSIDRPHVAKITPSYSSR